MDELTTTGTDVETRREYLERLDELDTRQRTMVGGILQLRYDIGRLADDVMTAESDGDTHSTYGRSVIAHIAERLDRPGREVHACLKFARRYSQEQLDELKARQWPWRGVAALLTTYSAEAMNEFRQKWEGGEYENTDQLRSAIAERNGEVRKSAKRKPKTGSREVMSCLKSFNTALNQYSARLQPDCTKAIKIFVKVGRTFPPATVEKITAVIRDVKKHLATLEKILPRVKKEIEVALAKPVEAEVS